MPRDEMFGLELESVPLDDEDRAAMLPLAGAEAWIDLAPWILSVGGERAASLMAMNLVIAWTRDKKGEWLPFDAKVCLTPLGAHRMDVDLDERGEMGVPRWVDAWATGEAQKRPFVVEPFERTYRMPFAEMVVDPRPGPAEIAEANDERSVLTDEAGEPVTLWGRTVQREKGKKRAG